MTPVVVTGVGAVTPAGIGADAFWQGITCPQTLPGARPVVDGEPAVLSLPDSGWTASLPVPAGQLDPAARMAVAATAEALTAAGLGRDAADPHRIAVVIGNGAGGVMSMDEGFKRLYVDGMRRTHPLTVAKSMVSSSASWVSMAFGARGPAFVVASACASGTQAVGIGLGLIRAGLADVVIAGGTEAPLSLGTIRAWESMRILAPDACRPFSRGRAGLMLGEGAGILILEAEAHARARGARPLARLDGYASSSDAGDLLAPSVDGMVRSMTAALADSGRSAADIGYVNAHGTGTQANDRAESEALLTVFGSNPPPVSSIKGATGHGLGAAGGIEAVACVLALVRDELPPTANHLADDPDCPVDCIPNIARRAAVPAVLSNSFAFGGHNASLVFSRI